MRLLLADKLHRYRLALGINVSVWLLQSLIFILWADSKSLLGDALHSLSDMVVLLGVVVLTARELAHPEDEHHEADRRFTRFAVILLVASAFYVFFEGVGRILEPESYPAGIVIAITLVAVVGNWSAHRIMSGVREDVHDHKHEASILHVLADLVISIVVLLSALGTLFLGTPALDGWGAIIVALWMLLRGVTLWRSTSGESHHHHHH